MEARTRSDRIIRLRNQHGRIVAHIDHGCLVIQWRERGEKGTATWPMERIVELMSQTQEAGA
jgi:hypothetical protein